MTEATSDPGSGETNETSRRMRFAGGGIFALVLLAAMLFAVHWWRDLRFLESTEDAFLESTLLLLSPRVGGTVLEVPVKENQRVQVGDVLVRLDPTDFRVRLSRAQADLDAARNRMESARASAESAEAQKRVSGIELGRAERELRRVHALFARHAMSEQAFENATAQRDAAVARVRSLEGKARSERAVLGNEAPVRQAEAALHRAELELSYTTVVAPVEGVVGQKNVSPGENVSPGQPLLALAVEECAWVTANFKETQIGRMRVGDPAQVSIDAYPNRVWPGHIESLAPATGAKYALIPPDNATGNFTKVVQRLPVKIVLDACSPGPAGEHAVDGVRDLPLGLSVEVSVRVGGS